MNGQATFKKLILFSENLLGPNLLEKIFLYLGGLFIFCTPAFAGPTHNIKVSTDATGARPVEVMLLIDRIYDVDLSSSTYRVEAEIILDWKDPALVKRLRRQHQETTFTSAKLDKIFDSTWHPEFIISNETKPRITDFRTLKIFDDGTVEIFEKFIAQIAFEADIHEYPFGDLDLTLDISAFTHEIHEMVLKPTSFEIGHTQEKEQVIRGPWYLKNKYVVESRDHRLSSHTSIFSHNKFHFILQHDYMDAVQKMLLPIAAVLIFSTFLNYFLTLKFSPNADWRIGGQITLFLSILALKFSLSGQIPATHYLKFVDELFLIATLGVGLNLIMSIVIQKLYVENPDGCASRIESIYKFSQPLILVALLCWTIYSTFHVRTSPSSNHCQNNSVACINVPLPKRDIRK